MNLELGVGSDNLDSPVARLGGNEMRLLVIGHGLVSVSPIAFRASFSCCARHTGAQSK